MSEVINTVHAHFPGIGVVGNSAITLGGEFLTEVSGELFGDLNVLLSQTDCDCAVAFMNRENQLTKGLSVDRIDLLLDSSENTTDDQHDALRTGWAKVLAGLVSECVHVTGSNTDFIDALESEHVSVASSDCAQRVVDILCRVHDANHGH